VKAAVFYSWNLQIVHAFCDHRNMVWKGSRAFCVELWRTTHVSVYNRSFMVVTPGAFTQTNSGTLRQKKREGNKSQDRRSRPLRVKQGPPCISSRETRLQCVWKDTSVWKKKLQLTFRELFFVEISLISRKSCCPATAMQTTRERGYSSYSFLTSALDWGEWSASRPSRALPPVLIE
jgi:hypothetical protein